MPAFIVTYELVDAYERLSSKTFETVDTLVDAAAAQTAAADLADDIAALSEMRVLAYTVKERTVYVDVADVGANKDEGVTFTLRKADNYKSPIRIPAPINGIFNGDGTVDLSNSIVTNFINNFLIGGNFVFSDGEQAQELVKGVLDK